MDKLKHIAVNDEIKRKFDKFKIDLTYKFKQRITSDRAIDILINSYKINNKEDNL